MSAFPIWPFRISLVLFLLCVAEFTRRAWRGPLWQRVAVVSYILYEAAVILTDSPKIDPYRLYWLPASAPATVLAFGGTLGCFWSRDASRSDSGRDYAAAVLAWTTVLLMAYVCFRMGRTTFRPVD